MNAVWKQSGKRIVSLLLAAALLLSAPVALAAEGDSEAPESAESSSTVSAPEESGLPESSGLPLESSEPEGGMASEPEEPEPSSGVSEEPESAPPEEGGATEGTEAGTFAANPLLVTGGHNTYLLGYRGGYFKPETAMTRAEVAQMLYNLLAAKPAVSKSQFSDVALSSWYGTPVNALAESGVLKGYKDGTFLPNKTITRAEFVTALAKCFAMETGNVSFSDVAGTSWAYSYIMSACAKGWLDGYEDGTFRPDKGIKRCEAVKIVNVALGRKGDGFAADRNVQKFKDVPKTHWAFLDIAEAAKPVDGGSTADPDPDDPEPNGDIKVGSSVRVTAVGGLNLREGPNTTSKVVTVLNTGAILTVTDVSQAPWIKVKTSNNAAGYVRSDFVEVYVPGEASGAKLSASSVTLHQYQTARVDGSVTSGLDAMRWISSDPSVAVVGYTVDYGGSKEEGGMIYGKKPGTATITFTDDAGKNKATCKVTVTAPEAVRFAYSDQNVVPLGASFNLTAITDSSRSGAKFQITGGPASGTYETTTYDTASQKSSHGLDTNNVRIFKKSVTFGQAGTYTVRAYSKNSSGYSSDFYEFTVMVSSSSSASTTETTFNSRRASTEIIKILANFEGFISEIKDDQVAAKNPTVGHGYVVPVNGTFYNTLTSQEALAFLVNTVNQKGYSSSVERFRANNNLKMSQAQFDALVSFVYNCGSGALDPAEYYTPNVIINAVTPPSGLSASNPSTGTLNVGSAEIFKEASVDSAVVATVGNGKTVSVTGSKVISSSKRVWYQVKYGSYTGWMPAGNIRLSGSGLTHDLAYADSTVLANNLLQWHKAGTECIPGLLYRRLAEAKIFFFGNYAEAYHSNANYQKNTYGFDYPGCCEEYDKR